jgi:hypothetical protein
VPVSLHACGTCATVQLRQQLAAYEQEVVGDIQQPLQWLCPLCARLAPSWWQPRRLGLLLLDLGIWC